MTQQPLVLTRAAEEEGSSNPAGSAQISEEGILITLTLDAAQISAVVSAVQSEASVDTVSTPASHFSNPHTNVKLANPKATKTSSTRHSVSFAETGASSGNDDVPSPVRTSSPATHSHSLPGNVESSATDTEVFSPSSGGIKAVLTKTSSSLLPEATSSSTTKVFSPSAGIKAVVTKSGSSTEGASETASKPSSSPRVAAGSQASSGSSSSIDTLSSSTPNALGNASSASASTTANSSSAHSTVTVTTTATTRVRSSGTSSNTRVAVTSMVARPVITDANGIPVVTVYETTGTAFVTASTPSTAASGVAESKKNFFQTIDSSPTAKALTAIISAIVILLIALAVWLCMRRRTRKPKRRDSLFDFAPDATDAKTIASSYSEKTPIMASAAMPAGASYPFTGDHASFGYDSRYVEAPSSTPAQSPRQATEDAHQASASAVRFAGIYPCIPPERRKSSVDLSLVYRVAPEQSPREVGHDNFSTTAEAHSTGPSGHPIIVHPASSSPVSNQEVWGQAHDASTLAVPARPARPASLSGSITKKIDEMYNVSTPRSSMSVLPPVSRPWMRQARKWASMSSMGGGGPDRRPSVDRRLYQQQLPSRFSITTFATSVEASPDLGAFRPRRTAITEQHLGDSMLRTDIFKVPAFEANKQDANPFSDLARVAPEHAPIDTPSPMSLSEPWASTSPLQMQSSTLQNEVMPDDTESTQSSQSVSVESESVKRSLEAESDESASDESLETASQASAIDEEEEANIRALIKRRQSGSSGKAM